MRFLRTNTAVIITVGPFYDKTDGVTIKTALTITNERITLTADTDAGSAPTNILDNITGATSGTSNDLNYITGNDAGMMQLELAAADTNRLGRMMLSITDAANHVPVFHEFMVLPAMIYDAFILGTDVLDASVTQILGTAVSTPATAGILDVNVKNIDNDAASASGTVTFPNATLASTVNITAATGIDVTKWLGTAASTPTVAGVPNVNVKTWNDLATVALPLVPTTAGRTLDVSVGGEAGLDWANVGSSTTALALTGTTIAVTQKVDVDTIKTNPVVNAGTITFPTTATLASTTNITAGTVTTATNVTTVNGLAASVITAASIAADAITAAKVADGTIDAATFAAGAINAAAIAADAIGASELAADAVTEIRSLVSGTSDSGSTTTMVDAARTEADTDYWKGALIVFTSGNIIGQSRVITAFNAATDTFTFSPATTQAVATQTYEIWPAGDFLRPTTSGRTLDVSAGGEAGLDWANIGSPTTAQNLSATNIDVDQVVASVSGAVASVTGLTASDVGAIKTKTDSLTFTTANRVDSQVFGMQADTVTASAIATDAIGSAELAATAITEIQAGLSTLDAAGIRTAVGLGSANLDTQLSTIDDFLDTEVQAIKDKTDLIAAAFGKTTSAIGRGTVTTGGSTTSIPTSAFTPAGAVADQFKNRVVLFDADTTTTALRGQAATISVSSNSATPTFTVAAMTTAPVSGDTFSVI